MDLTPSQPPAPDGVPADGEQPELQPHPQQADQPSQEHLEQREHPRSQPPRQDQEPHDQEPHRLAAEGLAAPGRAQGLEPPAQPHTEEQQTRLPSSTGVTRTGKEIGGKKFRVGAGDEYVPFRSRTKRRRRMITAGVVAVVLIGAGAYGVVSLVGSPSAEANAASGCPAPGTSSNGKAGAGALGSQNASHGNAAAADAKLPATNQIVLNVYNATTRQGLAHGVATQLKQRGFKVGQVINDPLKLKVAAAAQIRGGTAGAPAMRVVAAEVAGAQLHPDTRPDGSVDLVLGAGFSSLSTPDQVSAALKAVTAAAQKAAAKNGCS
ncbi:MAG: LytR C-terminal domain-containing protein [Actinocrinis sp.]